jgi:hypothetical protein
MCCYSREAQRRCRKPPLEAVRAAGNRSGFSGFDAAPLAISSSSGVDYSRASSLIVTFRDREIYSRMAIESSNEVIGRERRFVARLCS